MANIFLDSMIVTHIENRAGTAIRDATKHLGSITVVLSYCEQPLHWVESFLRTEFEISINIISKCEMPLTGIKSNTNFNVINNKGDKNHHYSYAQWISNMTNVTRENQNDVVIFLNDMPHRSKDWKWWSLNDVLRTVASNGFACFESVYEAPGVRKLQIDNGVLGYYHEKVTLEEYEPNSFKGFHPWFESTEISKMRDWITAIKADKFFVQEFVPVCYVRNSNVDACSDIFLMYFLMIAHRVEHLPQQRAVLIKLKKSLARWNCFLKGKMIL